MAYTRGHGSAFVLTDDNARSYNARNALNFLFAEEISRMTPFPAYLTEERAVIPQALIQRRVHGIRQRRTRVAYIELSLMAMSVLLKTEERRSNQLIS